MDGKQVKNKSNPTGTGKYLDERGVYVPVPSNGLIITTIEKDLGYPAKSSGNFLITGLSGLTANKQVVISQSAGSYTNKGDDEIEFDCVTCSGIVIDATTIKVFYNSKYPIGGKFKFNYFIQ